MMCMGTLQNIRLFDFCSSVIHPKDYSSKEPCSDGLESFWYVRTRIRTHRCFVEVIKSLDDVTMVACELEVT